MEWEISILEEEEKEEEKAIERINAPSSFQTSLRLDAHMYVIGADIDGWMDWTGWLKQRE